MPNFCPDLQKYPEGKIRKFYYSFAGRIKEWKFRMTAADALYYVSEEWDIELNALMDKYEFEFDSIERSESGIDEVAPFIARLGMQEIWLGNHPHYSFTPACGGRARFEMGSPSKKTIWKATQKLKREIPKAIMMCKLTQIG